jgi:hypothetical protein
MASSEPSPIGTALERIRPDPVIQHAQRKPGHRSNENAARWAGLERADTNVRKIDEGAPPKQKPSPIDPKAQPATDHGACQEAETMISCGGVEAPVFYCDR